MISENIASVFKKNNEEIQSLNGLRAIAILFVIITHTAEIFDNSNYQINTIVRDVLYNLRSGVDLFFILSGFLISGGLYNSFKKHGKINFKNFYIKRSLRIFPAFYIFLILTFVAAKVQITFIPIDNSLREELTIKLAALFYDFIYIANYIISYHPHTWTLALEEQFYIIFPLFASIFLFKLNFRSRLAAYAVLYTIPLLFRILVHFSFLSSPSELYLLFRPFHLRYDGFILGICIMDVYYNTKVIQNILPRNFVLINIFTFVFFTAGHLKNFYNSIDFHFMIPFQVNLYQAAYALIFITALNGKNRVADFLKLRFFTPIARVSYGMYLWQFIALMLAGFVFVLYDSNIQHKINLLVYILMHILTIIISFLIAFFFYVFTERPFLLLKKRLTR
ncbi:MAG: acyltransferase [Spirochaetia bacterium]|nr:acyltransferase [Spirochaetia bacterium]